MGMESPTVPQIPDLAIVAETIRLADLAEAERYDQRPQEWPEYRVADVKEVFRPRPARDALVSFLRNQSEETVAGLYSLYRLGDPPRPSPAVALECYRCSYELAIQPIHSEHGADDLAAKAPLAEGLRRGMALLGLAILGLAIEPPPLGPTA